MGIYSRDEIEKILNQYGDSIHRMALIQVKKEDVAEDIYQDVCIKLLRQKAYIEPEELKDGSYWCLYENQDLLAENTGIVISESEKLDLKDIVVNIGTIYKTGHLSLEVACDVGQCHMNGMFLMDGYTGEEYDYSEYGYGEETKAYYVYEYAEGKEACFVKDSDANKWQRVYFSERGILYQLFVENSNAGKELGKKIVDYMSE